MTDRTRAVRSRGSNTDDDLDVIAADIHREIADVNAHLLDGVEGMLRIGARIRDARRLIPSNRDFGAWCDAQSFPWSRPTLYRLGVIAADPARARAAIDAIRSERGPGADVKITTLYRAMVPPKVAVHPPELPAPSQSRDDGPRGIMAPDERVTGEYFVDVAKRHGLVACQCHEMFLTDADWMAHQLATPALGHGVPLSHDERDAAIVRLYRLGRPAPKVLHARVVKSDATPTIVNARIVRKADR